MFASEIIREPVIQFRSKSVLLYNHWHRPDGGFERSEKFDLNVKKLVKREKYTGQMTTGAKKRLSKAVSLLVQTAVNEYIYNPVTGKNQHHKLSFITLTLPDVEKSKDAKFTHKFLLQPFLQTMRRSHGMKSYIWKAELQRNGSVHYHITTHSFIPYTDIRDRWNYLTRKHGMLDDFREKYGHDNPNSIDIHSVQKVNDMEAYLVKYISKETQNEESLSGKVWDCSKNLKACNYFTTTETSDITAQLLQDVYSGECQAFEMEHCTILRYRYEDYYLAFGQSIINRYYSHLNDVRKWEYVKTSTQKTVTQNYQNRSDVMKKQKTRYQKDKKKGLSQNYGHQSTMFQTLPSGFILQSTLNQPVDGRQFEAPPRSATISHDRRE